LTSALEQAGSLGILVNGHPYRRGQIIDAVVAGAGVERSRAEKLFTVLRTAASADGLVGGLRVHGEGERRGRKYIISGLPEGQAPQGPGVVRQHETRTPGIGEDGGAVGTRVTRIEGVAGPQGDAKLDIYLGDNLPILKSLPDGSFDLIYVDPPFNTGKAQTMTRIRTVQDREGGDRTGFQGRRYRTVQVGSSSFEDTFDDYMAFLEPRLLEARRLLKPSGSFFLHIDYREVHYCKVLLDAIFGRDSFLNEIIWAYDYGARTKRRWSAKHDNILWYVKDPSDYTFNFDEMDRIPYMAPGLVGAEKAARGKTPTDVWWHTIVPTNGKERTGYSTQKPLGVLSRIVKVHSRPGDRLLDFFAGSGTLGEAAFRLGRSAVLIDSSEEALRVMAERLAFAEPTFHGYSPAGPAEQPEPKDAAVAAPRRRGRPRPQQQSLFGEAEA